MRRIHHSHAIPALVSCLGVLVGNPERLDCQTTSYDWKKVESWEQIGGRVLEKPTLIAVDRERVYVFDAGPGRILSVDRDGGSAWQFGRRGSGPGEFESPTSMVVNSQGHVLVLDAALARLTVISDSGRLVRTVPITGTLHRLAFAEGGVQATLVTGVNCVARLEESGRVSPRGACPGDIRNLSALQREPHIAALPTGVVVAFRWSTRLLRYSNAVVRADRDMSVPVGFPEITTQQAGAPNTRVRRVHPNANPVVMSVTAGESAILVLAHSPGRPNAREVRRYDLSTLGWLGGESIEGDPRMIVSRGAELIGVEWDPVPAITIWRRVVP